MSRLTSCFFFAETTNDTLGGGKLFTRAYKNSSEQPDTDMIYVIAVSRFVEGGEAEFIVSPIKK